MIWWIIGGILLSPFIILFTLVFATIWFGAWVELKNMIWGEG